MKLEDLKNASRNNFLRTGRFRQPPVSVTRQQFLDLLDELTENRIFYTLTEQGELDEMPYMTATFGGLYAVSSNG